MIMAETYDPNAPTVIPPPDEATENSWASSLLKQGDAMYDAWFSAELQHDLMMRERQQWGLPIYDEKWTEKEEQAYWALHDMTLRMVDYLDEVKRRVRAVGKDPTVDNVMALAMAGEPTFSVKDGVITMSIAGKPMSSVDTNGFVGGWQVLAGVVAVALSAAVVVVCYTTWQKAKDRLEAARVENLQKHTDECLKTHTLEECKKIIELETRQIVEQNNSQQPTDLSKLTDALKTVAVAAAVLGVAGAGVYFGMKLWPSGRTKNPISKRKEKATMRAMLKAHGYDYDAREVEALYNKEGVRLSALEQYLEDDTRGAGPFPRGSLAEHFRGMRTGLSGREYPSSPSPYFWGNE